MNGEEDEENRMNGKSKMCLISQPEYKVRTIDALIISISYKQTTVRQLNKRSWATFVLCSDNC
jgi:hypothetical protein